MLQWKLNDTEYETLHYLDYAHMFQQHEHTTNTPQRDTLIRIQDIKYIPNHKKDNFGKMHYFVLMKNASTPKWIPAHRIEELPEAWKTDLITRRTLQGTARRAYVRNRYKGPPRKGHINEE